LFALKNQESLKNCFGLKTSFFIFLENIKTPSLS